MYKHFIPVFLFVLAFMFFGLWLGEFDLFKRGAGWVAIWFCGLPFCAGVSTLICQFIQEQCCES